MPREKKPAEKYPRIPVVRALHRLLRDPKASGTAKTLGAILVDYVNDHGECWPSQRELAKSMGREVRTIQRGIAELRDLGYIVTKSRSRGGGRGRSTDLIAWQLDLFPLLVLEPTVDNPTTNPTNMSPWSPDQPDTGGGLTRQKCRGDTMKFPTEEKEERSRASTATATVDNSASGETGGDGIGPGSKWEQEKLRLQPAKAGVA